MNTLQNWAKGLNLMILGSMQHICDHLNSPHSYTVLFKVELYHFQEGEVL